MLCPTRTKPVSAIWGRRVTSDCTSSARFEMEYAAGECGPVEWPQPRKSIANTGYVEESKGLSFEKVRAEPPQKCRKMRAGEDLAETDVEGAVEYMLSVVRGATA
jgi:hypothetical protein